MKKCCCDCALTGHEFADSTGLTVESGSWTFTGAADTSSTNAIVLVDENHPQQSRIAYDIEDTASASLDQTYLIIHSWADSNNYIYGSVRLQGVDSDTTTVTVQLRKVVAGSDTLEDSMSGTFESSLPGATLCLERMASQYTYVSFGCDNSSGGAFDWEPCKRLIACAKITDSVFGNKIGIGTGATLSDGLTVAALEANRSLNDTDCACCLCSGVCDRAKRIPKEWQAVLSGTVDEDDSLCDELDGTYTNIVHDGGTNLALGAAGGTVGCQWAQDIGTSGSGNEVALVIYSYRNAAGDKTYLAVDIVTDLTGSPSLMASGEVEFTKEFCDCNQTFEVDLTDISSHCNFSSATVTCTVTSRYGG